MTAVDQNHTIGLTAPLAEGLKQGQETSVTAAAQLAAAALVTVGGDRVPTPTINGIVSFGQRPHQRQRASGSLGAVLT